MSEESAPQENDDDEPYRRPKRPPEDTEIDITPMIDVTFQLLIFFMVTSTMQGNPPAQVPKSVSGGSTEMAKIAFTVVVRAPATTNVDPVIEIDKVPVTLDELRARVAEEASSAVDGISLMIMADRSVPNRFTGEIETMFGEIPGVSYHFAVQDRRD
ncbi:MAG: ExbD/TolR family protein [Planctomycetota bacterium]